MGRRIPTDVFERWVREHHAAVFRSAMRVLGHEPDALDVSQVVFCRVLEGKERLDPGDDPERVLRWLAAKHALTHLRTSRNRRDYERKRAMRTDEPAPIPELDAESREASGVIGRLVDVLPEDLRHAIVMRFMEGLTYAEIARASECSEPTAHERVQRGLEKLERGLGRAGLAALVPVLPERLARVEPPAVPAGLEATLLALGAGGAATVSAPVVLAAVGALAAIGAVVGGALLVGEGRADVGDVPDVSGGLAVAPLVVPATVPAGIAASPAGREAIDGRAAVAGSSAAPAPGLPPVGRPGEWTVVPDVDEETGTLTGRLVDEHGAAVAGLVVELDHSGKKGSFVMSGHGTASDENGRFRVDLPVRGDGSDYDLRVLSDDFRDHWERGLRIRANETTEVGEIRLVRSSADPLGDFTLALTVADPDGVPVGRADAVLLRRVTDENGEWKDSIEARGRTDERGRLELAGRHLGRKTLRIRLYGGDLRPHEESLRVDTEGLTDHPVSLARGHVIEGTLADASGAPVPRVGNLELLGAAALRVRADWPEPGRFRFRGLDDGPFTLELWDGTYSHVRLAGVRPDGGSLDLVLKRQDDTRDVGHHRAEIHGRLVDAVTGEPVAVKPRAIDYEWIADFEPGTFESDVLPDLLYPRPRQIGIPPVPPPERADFHLTNLHPYVYVVAVRAPGYAPAFAGPFDLDEGRLVSGVVIELSRPAVVEGCVVDRDGEPLEGAFVLLLGSGDPASARLQRLDGIVAKDRERKDIAYGPSSARTGPDGRFSIPGVPPGFALHLAALHADREPVVLGTVELRPGETTSGVEVKLGTAR